jgi:hypothetical protein|tara:strand:+ start:2789 stop:3163 length:375 start_codon:yes stop_codon:yes gene_type:complete
MAYYDSIQLVKGDTLPELNLTLRDSNTAATGKVLDADDVSTWAPIDLTGTTVRLKFKALGSTDLKSTITMSKHAPYTEGKVFMQWPSGVLDTAGTFTGEVEVTYSGGGVQTVFDQLKFKVRGDY